MLISRVPPCPPPLISCIPKSNPRNDIPQWKEREREKKSTNCRYANDEIIIRRQGKAAKLRDGTDRQTASSFREPGTVDDEEDRDSDSNCLGIARIAAN